MRHATPDDLVEKRPGAFSVRSRAFMHFHADPAGLYVDVRLDGEEFERRPVHTRAQQRALVRDVRAAVGERRPETRRRGA